MHTELNTLIQPVIEIAGAAGAEILKIYGSDDFGVVLEFARESPAYDRSVLTSRKPALSGRAGAIVTERASLRMAVAALGLTLRPTGKAIAAFEHRDAAVAWVVERLGGTGNGGAR